ncbi:MAG: hypothetical protein ABI999_08555 [Acidobacteriota bacterium]
MWNEIVFYIIEKGAESTPSFVLRRLIPAAKLKGKIDVDLRRDSPIGFVDSAQVPHVSLWFDITNRSSLNLVLEKVYLDVWFGQPTFVGWILKPIEIPRTENVKDILYWQDLTQAQVKQYQWCRDTIKGNITVNLIAYFNSKIGTIVLEKRVERKLVTG